VTLFDIGEESGIPYLAMEFVEGETIASILERGTRFAPEKVVVLISQIASALDYAHSKGVIHRDVKPANLMLFEGDRVKVTDFGIAKLMDAEMTQAGVLLGTPSYMSPERASSPSPARTSPRSSTSSSTSTPSSPRTSR
jgi:serine/threonine-protein kinase